MEQRKPFDLEAALGNKMKNTENNVAKAMGGVVTGKSEGGIDIPEGPEGNAEILDASGLPITHEDQVGQAGLEKEITQAPRGVPEGEKPELTIGDDFEAAGIIDKTTLSTEDQAKLENFIGGLPTQKEMDFGVITVGHIARICHEANRELCKALGDDSQVAWDSAPVWQKESAMSGVKKILTGEINSPMESHASWMEEKYKDGWRFGEVKDAEAKTHPCLVPYAGLPPAQQSKDFLFHSVVQGLGLFIKKED